MPAGDLGYISDRGTRPPPLATTSRSERQVIPAGDLGYISNHCGQMSHGSGTVEKSPRDSVKWQCSLILGQATVRIHLESRKQNSNSELFDFHRLDNSSLGLHYDRALNAAPYGTQCGE
jgi:hypothetical protein